MFPYAIYRFATPIRQIASVKLDLPLTTTVLNRINGRSIVF